MLEWGFHSGARRAMIWRNPDPCDRAEAALHNAPPEKARHAQID